jgi:hypothetical protein
VADAPAAAARVLRVALLASAAAAFAGVVLDPVLRALPLGSGDAVGRVFRSAAIGIVIATPFVVLVLLVVIERGRRLGWYAAGTLLVALAGILLVR